MDKDLFIFRLGTLHNIHLERTHRLTEMFTRELEIGPGNKTIHIDQVDSCIFFYF